jgi:hypothetical protein
MYHDPNLDDTVASPLCPVLLTFFTDHADALRNAAYLLSRGRGLRIVDHIIDSISKRPTLTRTTWQAIQELYDILTLENVDDLESVEAACFAVLDPAAPVVEDICLLTDQFRDALEHADQSQAPQLRPAA